jgi:hypothetical protein
MSRWSKAGAFVAWLGLVVAARAQSPVIPCPVGAARMPEPTPIGAAPDKTPLPNLVPGPITPEMAPPGPPCEMDLPGNHSSAFQCEYYPPEEKYFFHPGALAFQRQRYNHTVLAVRDPQTLDTGNPPPRNAPVIAQFSDTVPEMAPGVQFTVGYLYHDQAVELTGFYVFNNLRSQTIVNRGRIDLPFNHPPLGFEGDNGLWLQADDTTTRLASTLAGAELNYRYWHAGFESCDLICGVRYVYLRDYFSNFTGDDDLTFLGTNGLPDTRRQATYTVGVTNNIVAPQVGFEWDCPLLGKKVKWLWFGIDSKVALGANMIHTERKLTRGDGFLGFDQSQSRTAFAQVYEGGAFFEFHIAEKFQIKAGYNVLLMGGVVGAEDRVDFNLSNPLGTTDKTRSMFFHGPMAELRFLF